MQDQKTTRLLWKYHNRRLDRIEFHESRQQESEDLKLIRAPAPHGRTAQAPAPAGTAEEPAAEVKVEPKSFSFSFRGQAAKE